MGGGKCDVIFALKLHRIVRISLGGLWMVCHSWMSASETTDRPTATSSSIETLSSIDMRSASILALILLRVDWKGDFVDSSDLLMDAVFVAKDVTWMDCDLPLGWDLMSGTLRNPVFVGVVPS